MAGTRVFFPKFFDYLLSPFLFSDIKTLGNEPGVFLHKFAAAFSCRDKECLFHQFSIISFTASRISFWKWP